MTNRQRLLRGSSSDIRYSNLSSELENSPIVKHSVIHTASFAVSYHFNTVVCDLLKQISG
ncbi:MAG: MipA/OmpV family protein [Gammaproteobacteria bacterium]|nr:MipA/OmpV family protein [Gammaproteobacteria bacterium]